MHWLGPLTAIASAGVQFVLFLRWLHRRMRDDEINRAFIRDLALTHLPHIYGALQSVCQQQGIAVHPAPTVRFVDLGSAGGGANGHRRTP
jgi:hypothetical protein